MKISAFIDSNEDIYGVTPHEEEGEDPKVVEEAEGLVHRISHSVHGPQRQEHLTPVLEEIIEHE